jgi:hypothetical protein
MTAVKGWNFESQDLMEKKFIDTAYMLLCKDPDRFVDVLCSLVGATMEYLGEESPESLKAMNEILRNLIVPKERLI